MNRDRPWNRNKRGGNRGGPNRGGSNRGGYQFRGNSNWSGNRNFGFRDGKPQNNSDNYQWNKRPKRETPGKRLREEDIGVTEYMSDHKGFNGIIKSRYSDFQVSEINEKGEVAKLTDQSPPQLLQEEIVEDEELVFNKYNLEILPMDTWDKINKLVTPSDEPADVVEIDVTGVSKEQRTKIHDAVKKAFGDCVIGSTVNIDDKKLMRFDKYRKGVRVDTRVKWVWPAEYVHFIVYKENCDTLEAAVRIAERLRLNIKPTMLGYAGTKDRRAKTSQWFSLRKVDPRKIAVSCKDLRDVHIGNFSFSHTHLKLGMLKGNKFRIALRNVTESDELVDEMCNNLKERGFINYYGLQRFGSRVDVPTYDIGRKLLQGNFREAISGILEEREGPLQQALLVYKQAGAAAALRYLPRRNSAAHSEARLLKALADRPNDLVTAMDKVPRNMRLLYLHAYQSLVWNRAVSERLRRLGRAPALGDLVPLDQLHPHYESCDEDSDSEDNQTDTESQQDGGDTQDGVKDKNTSENDKKKQKRAMDEPKPKIPVKVLTQEDVDSSKYSIFDIIMPLPGYNIDYPPNMKDYYEQLLTEDGLTLDLKHKIKSYSMCGAYRRVAARAGGAEWRRARYADPRADLIASDLDELEGAPPPGTVADGKYKALLLTMSLPTSCYATMALRELLKVDTSSNSQAQQNDYYKRESSDAGAGPGPGEGEGEGSDAKKAKIDGAE